MLEGRTQTRNRACARLRSLLTFRTVRKLSYRAVSLLLCIAIGWSWVSFVLPDSNLQTRKAGHPLVSRTPRSRRSASTANLADILFPIPIASKSSPWVHMNHLILQSLFGCIENFDCHARQMKVVLLSSDQFRADLAGGTSGEQIWSVIFRNNVLGNILNIQLLRRRAKSTTKALENLGYTFLYTSSIEQTVLLYQMLPDLVKAILADDHQVEHCLNDTQYCALSVANPVGIPPWKMFSFAFWAQAAHPLGHPWTLAPENYELLGLGHNTYLGYSIEHTCQTRTFIPHSMRENQAYVLAKVLSYFTLERDRAWTSAMFDAATKATGIKFVIGAFNDTEGGESDVELPSNRIDFGPMGQSTFLDRLSKTRVLIGMGHPSTSPTPYDALCLGVPFINPVLRWDEDNPSDKSRWVTQHPVLELLEPPYVYNVFRGDLEGFVRAVTDAISHPIQSYVLEDMRLSSVEKRLVKILEKDWKREADLQAS